MWAPLSKTFYVLHFCLPGGGSLPSNRKQTFPSFFLCPLLCILYVHLCCGLARGRAPWKMCFTPTKAAAYKMTQRETRQRLLTFQRVDASRPWQHLGCLAPMTNARAQWNVRLTHLAQSCCRGWREDFKAGRSWISFLPSSFPLAFSYLSVWPGHRRSEETT